MGFTWTFSQAVGTFASTYRNLTYATLENTDLAQKERFFKRSLVSSIPFAFILGLLQNKTLSPIEIEGLVNWMWILVNTVLSNTAGTQMDQILQLTRIEDPKSDNWYFFNKKTKIKKAEFRENNMSMIKYLYKMFDLMDISFQQVKMGKIVAVTSIPLIQMIIINLANRLTLDNPKAIQMRKDMNARFERSYRKFFNITQGRFSLKNYLRENITSPEIVQMKAEFLSLLPDDETFADDANCLEDALFGR
ncbi:MAG: hypothetical protein KBD63_07290 [Bacteriovoracaceae bacterium]|nr:hypothetical protein [Bacteriovoracaceae bacterium]